MLKQFFKILGQLLIILILLIAIKYEDRLFIFDKEAAQFAESLVYKGSKNSKSIAVGPNEYFLFDHIKKNTLRAMTSIDRGKRPAVIRKIKEITNRAKITNPDYLLLFLKNTPQKDWDNAINAALKGSGKDKILDSRRLYKIFHVN